MTMLSTAIVLFLNNSIFSLCLGKGMLMEVTHLAQIHLFRMSRCGPANSCLTDYSLWSIQCTTLTTASKLATTCLKNFNNLTFAKVEGFTKMNW